MIWSQISCPQFRVRNLTSRLARFGWIGTQDVVHVVFSSRWQIWFNRLLKGLVPPRTRMTCAVHLRSSIVYHFFGAHCCSSFELCEKHFSFPHQFLSWMDLCQGVFHKVPLTQPTADWFGAGRPLQNFVWKRQRSFWIFGFMKMGWTILKLDCFTGDDKNLVSAIYGPRCLRPNHTI